MRLKEFADKGQLLDGYWMKNIDEASLSNIFHMPADFELITMFRKSLNNVGNFLVEEFSGQQKLLLESINKSADNLITSLARNTKSFRDISIYKGSEVYSLFN